MEDQVLFHPNVHSKNYMKIEFTEKSQNSKLLQHTTFLSKRENIIAAISEMN